MGSGSRTAAGVGIGSHPAIARQIAQLESSGVTFVRCSKEDAAAYLVTHTYCHKLVAYLPLFEHRKGGPNDGRSVGVDFSDLKELSSVDQHLRYALLPMTLDVEHFAKVKIMREIVVRGEDEYRIVADYLASLGVSERRRRAHEICQHRRLAQEERVAPEDGHPGLSACELVDALSFGAFADFYRFCAKRWKDTAMVEEHYLLRTVKNARNAYAHSSPVVAGFAYADSTIMQSGGIGRALSDAGVSKRVRAGKMKSVRLQQIATVLYLHKRMVAGQTSREHARIRVGELAAEMREVRSHLAANDAIRSSFDFLIRLFEAWL